MPRIVAALILMSGLELRAFDVAHLPGRFATPTSEYFWTALTASAAFPGAYNFPVFVVRNQMWAFHPRGNWFITWREVAAPWSPRGAPAVWVMGDRLYMTGGKYSVMENGSPRFIYRNDVWYMTRSAK